MPKASHARDDARAIWQAGVDSVRSERLVRDVIQVRGSQLTLCGHHFSLDAVGRIAVVGAGKAGAGMAAAVEEAIPADRVDRQVVGWVNVPADCVRPLRRIHLCAARPAGVNEPTEEGVRGAARMLHLVSELEGNDLCIVLLSGGGSALAPAPKPPVTLDDKQAVTRLLMHSGATIDQLNTVRKRLSRIKGGGLARACRAGHLIGLIISDVVGDPLDVIASGPTVPDPTTHRDALAILREYGIKPPAIDRRVLDHLEAAIGDAGPPAPFPCRVANHIVGNNATALKAAEAKARELGYDVTSLGSENRGEADAVGRDLARRCVAARDRRDGGSRPICLLSGGEPIVRMTPTSKVGKGGRNQELVLAAVESLRDVGMDHLVILSGGTDGEDGPTDAAGAWADAQVIDDLRQLGIDPVPYLRYHNAYELFERVGGLLKTGPTHTNVMDLRVALVTNPRGSRPDS